MGDSPPSYSAIKETRARVYYPQGGRYQPLLQPGNSQQINPPRPFHYVHAPIVQGSNYDVHQPIQSDSLRVSRCGMFIIIMLAFFGGVFVISTIQFVSYPIGFLPPNEAFWGEPIAAPHCLAYGKRQYSAQLSNIPRRWNPVAACHDTPFELRGTTFGAPEWCEDRGTGGIVGHWTLDHGEMNCMPIFADFHDVGCVGQGSRLRRIEAQIRDIQRGDDWKVMCATTPVTWRGIHYPGPTQCEDRIWHRKVAIWDIEDLNC